MFGGEATAGGGETVVYCLVPQHLAGKLHEPLRRHFRDTPSVEVVVERRARERRTAGDRRTAAGETAASERRSVRNVEGRRVGSRRAAQLPADALALPRRLARYADQIAFVERIAPSDLVEEDLDTARLITRVQSGERELFAEVYMRYFDRVYSYLRVVLRDEHEAEDAAQQVFVKVLVALPRYERRAGRPFRAWLFTVARNLALTELRKLERVDVTDPVSIDRERDRSHHAEPDLAILDWISDRELLMFVERLPLAQRQVLLLRYMLDLTDAQIAAIVGRSQTDVRVLNSRAVRFLRARLAAVGRPPSRRDRSGWHRRLREAPVLRSRRFALTP